MTLEQIRRHIHTVGASKELALAMLDVVEMAQFVIDGAVWISDDYYLPVVDKTHREELDEVIKAVQACVD